LRHTNIPGEIDELGKRGVGGLDGPALQATLARIKPPLQHWFEPRLLGRAGVLDHVHWHVVPRWDGDTNYMPVIGATRVMPQALDELSVELMKHV
jgi:hypothetical protein